MRAAAVRSESGDGDVERTARMLDERSKRRKSRLVSEEATASPSSSTTPEARDPGPLARAPAVVGLSLTPPAPRLPYFAGADDEAA